MAEINGPKSVPEETRQAGQQALEEALRLGFRLLRAVMLALLGLYLLSGLFIVGQHEKAGVLLGGRLCGGPGERWRGPGLRWAPPPPFAEVVRVPAQRVQTVETAAFWYEPSRKDEPGPDTVPLQLNPLRDGCAVSGDANLFHSRWALRYTISDPETYAFRWADPASALRAELEHAVVKVAARTTVDAALRTDVEAFRAGVEAELRRRAQSADWGVAVQRVDVLALAPPRQVAAAFQAVVEAEQEQSRAVSEARAYAVRRHHETEGEAARRLAEARARKERRLAELRAGADYFQAVYEKYAQHPASTARTLLQDTLRRVLARVEHKYLVRRNERGEQEVWLQLGPPAAPHAVRSGPASAGAREP